MADDPRGRLVLGIDAPAVQQPHVHQVEDEQILRVLHAIDLVEAHVNTAWRREAMARMVGQRERERAACTKPHEAMARMVGGERESVRRARNRTVTARPGCSSRVRLARVITRARD